MADGEDVEFALLDQPVTGDGDVFEALDEHGVALVDVEDESQRDGLLDAGDAFLRGGMPDVVHDEAEILGRRHAFPVGQHVGDLVLEVPFEAVEHAADFV